MNLLSSFSEALSGGHGQFFGVQSVHFGEAGMDGADVADYSSTESLSRIPNL